MTCDDVRDQLVELLTEHAADDPRSHDSCSHDPCSHDADDTFDVTAWTADRLASGIHPDLRAHLERCRACQEEARTIGSLVRRLRSALATRPAAPDQSPAAATREDTVSPPPLEDVLEAVRRSTRARQVRARFVRPLLSAAVLLAAALLGAAADRAWVRGTHADVRPPSTSAELESPSADTTPVEADAALRSVVAERPGGLVTSLALLEALSEAAPEPGPR